MNMENAMHIMEEILETEYKGLIFINEERKIGSYSRCAKKITGILLENEQKHPGGRIEEGDIVIIADNEMGNDDELTVEKLETIGITDRNIKKGDALIAVGVYKNKKIQPQYKYVKGYNPNGRFELAVNYLGFEIASRIDFARNSMEISVNGDVYAMIFFESVGHMVVIDSATGKVKFFQARGYGYRGEEIGRLLAGKSYLPKLDYETSDEEGSELLPTVGEEIGSILYGDEILAEIEKMFGEADGCTEKGIYEIHKRPMFCVLTRIRKGNAQDGVYLILQDASLLEDVRRERDAIIQTLEQRQKKKIHRKPYDLEFHGEAMGDFIGEDPAMNEVKRLAYKASQTNFNVIITGESGTGKSRLAREIHKMGKKDAPFVEVNCNAIAPSLFESELFGYAAGAFTGAAAGGKAGFFEEANGGTIFLDEIGEIPLGIQVKLLHVLQNKRIYRVGSSKPIDVDVRVITATNRSLEEEVRKGNFRQDLYYRINVFPICIPPLRQRKGDLYILINSVLDDICKRYHMKHMLLSEEALQKMMNYSWPGNVRELENVMERAVTICDSPLIYSEHILIEEEAKQAMTLKEQLEREERRIIAETLANNRYKRRETMEELGLSKSVFYEKLKKYQLGGDE